MKKNSFAILSVEDDQVGTVNQRTISSNGVVESNNKCGVNYDTNDTSDNQWKHATSRHRPETQRHNAKPFHSGHVSTSRPERHYRHDTRRNDSSTSKRSANFSSPATVQRAEVSQHTDRQTSTVQSMQLKKTEVKLKICTTDEMLRQTKKSYFIPGTNNEWICPDNLIRVESNDSYSDEPTVRYYFNPTKFTADAYNKFETHSVNGQEMILAGISRLKLVRLEQPIVVKNENHVSMICAKMSWQFQPSVLKQKIVAI